jgi:hypothetical protein
MTATRSSPAGCSTRDTDAIRLDDRLGLLDVLPSSPLRPLDARWRLASELIRQGIRRPRRRWCDPWTRRALRFLRHAARVGGPDHPKVVRKDPALAGALGLRSGPDQLSRLAVEARLLAGQSDEVIARRGALPAEVVTVYEAVFFNVRHRLDAADSILFTAIGPRLYAEDGEPAPDVVVKLLAFLGGPPVADALLGLIDVRSGRSTWCWDTCADPRLVQVFELALAVQATPVNERTAPTLMRLNARMAEIERARAAGSAASVTESIAMTGIEVAIEVERSESSTPDARKVRAPGTPAACDRDEMASPAFDLADLGQPEYRLRATG